GWSAALLRAADRPPADEGDADARDAEHPPQLLGGGAAVDAEGVEDLALHVVGAEFARALAGGGDGEIAHLGALRGPEPGLEQHRRLLPGAVALLDGGVEDDGAQPAAVAFRDADEGVAGQVGETGLAAERPLETAGEQLVVVGHGEAI